MTCGCATESISLPDDDLLDGQAVFFGLTKHPMEEEKDKEPPPCAIMVSPGHAFCLHRSLYGVSRYSVIAFDT
ncbi:MAG: hypothetical protein LBQ00_04435, partial [Syntrophobacterales bacterium]|nr:hypothetical protein [Syntrophobacterales bacterium]